MAARRAGVVTFAGVLFILAGLFGIVDGIVALERPETLFAGENVFIVKDYDAYGAAMIVYGAIAILIGVGVLRGSRGAQIVAIVVATLAFIVHLAYFRHYPAWASVMMALNVVIIYALTVHSDEFGKAVR